MEEAFQNRVEYVAYWFAKYDPHPYSRASFLIIIGMLESAYFFTEDGLNSTILHYDKINNKDGL